MRIYLDMNVIKQAIFIGDSITQFGWSNSSDWLAKLANTFVRKLEIIGYGYSGYNTRAWLPMLPYLFPDQKSLKSCYLFTIFLGANDSSVEKQHVTIPEYEANLGAMVEFVTKLNVPKEHILLISLPPLDEDKWTRHQIAEGKNANRFAKNCLLYANACEKVARAHSTLFLDLYRTMSAQPEWKDYLFDGLHLSHKGSDFLARCLTNIIDEQPVELPTLFPPWNDIDFEDPQKSIDTYMNANFGTNMN